MEGENQGENLLVKIERADAEIKMLRELLSQKDERITHVAEEIGEMRSMLIRKDQDFSESSTKLEKLSSMVQELNPMEIAREMAKKEQKMAEGEMKIEKIEATIKDIRKGLDDLHQVLSKIEGFESLVNIHKEVDEKVSKVNKRSEDVMRIAEKVENTFFELDKRLREFDKTSASLQKIETLHKDVVRNMDKLMIQVDNAPKAEDIQNADKIYKQEVAEIKNSMEIEKTAVREDVASTKESLRTIQNELKNAQGQIKEMHVSVLENSKFNEAIKNQVREIYRDVENSTENLISTKGEIQAILRDFLKSITAMEERVIGNSNSVDDSRKRHLDVAANVNELSLTQSAMSGEISGNKKDLEAIKTDVSMLEGNISYLTNSMEGISTRLDAAKENIDRELKESVIERKRFMDSIKANVSNSGATYQETASMISSFNEQLKGVVEQLSKISENLGAEPDAEQVKSGVSDMVRSIGKLGNELGKN